MWIINKKADLLFILLPGLYIILLFLGLDIENAPATLAAVLFIYLIDDGHAYATIWRTIVGRKIQPKFIAIPIITFLTIFSWLYFKIPFFWALLAYNGIYHIIRQSYGFTRWYQHKIKWRSNWPTRLLYALLFLPIIIFHLVEERSVLIFNSPDELFIYPNELLATICITIYTTIIIASIIYLTLAFIKNKKTYPTILSIIVPAYVFYYSTTLAENAIQAVGPILIAHGLSYHAAMSHSMKVTTFQTYLKPTIYLIATALVFVTTQIAFEHAILGEFSLDTLGIGGQILLALVVTVTFSHYIFDMFIWRKKDPEFRSILNE